MDGDLRVRFLNTDVKSFVAEKVQNDLYVSKVITDKQADDYAGFVTDKLAAVVDQPAEFRKRAKQRGWTHELNTYFPEFECIMGFAL